MELYHKIAKEVLELLNKEGTMMPVDTVRKLKRSSSNLQQVRAYLIEIKVVESRRDNRGFYELKITEKGRMLLDALREVEALDNNIMGTPAPTATFHPIQPLKSIQMPDFGNEVNPRFPIDPGSVYNPEKVEEKYEEVPGKIQPGTDVGGGKKLDATVEEISRGGRRGKIVRLGVK